MAVSAARLPAGYLPPLTGMPLPDAWGVRPIALLAAAVLYSVLLAAACFNLPVTPAVPWPESQATFQLVLLQPAAAPAEPESSPVAPATAITEPPSTQPAAPESSRSLAEAPDTGEAIPEPAEQPVAEAAPPAPTRRSAAARAAARPPAYRALPPSASLAPSAPAPNTQQLTMMPPEAEIPPRPIGTAAGNAKPEYPAEARQRGWQGRVVLRVEVSTGGEPLTVNVRISSGHAVLDQAALHAVEAWRFVPATRGGAAVAGSVDVPVQFRLED